VERVAIVGPFGSGKSTLAETVANRIDGTAIDLDTLFHRADRQSTPTTEFRTRVSAALDIPRWAVAGKYSQVLDIVHGRADTIVWLDLPRTLVTWRVARRSFRRVVTREQLWNGHRETWSDLLSLDPGRNSVVWAWTQHGRTGALYERFFDGSFWEHADVHRLRTSADVDTFMAALPNDRR